MRRGWGSWSAYLLPPFPPQLFFSYTWLRHTHTLVFSSTSLPQTMATALLYYPWLCPPSVAEFAVPDRWVRRPRSLSSSSAITRCPPFLASRHPSQIGIPLLSQVVRHPSLNPPLQISVPLLPPPKLWPSFAVPQWVRLPCWHCFIYLFYNFMIDYSGLPLLVF